MDTIVGSFTKPVFRNQVGIGRLKEQAQWVDLPLPRRVKDVTTSVIKSLTLSLLVSSVLALVVSPVAAVVVGSVIAVASLFFLGRSIYIAHNLTSTSHQPPLEGAPKLGEWSENSAAITNSALSSYQLKLNLIAKAQHSIEISGSYCGGKVFDKCLDIIENQLNTKPHLKVKILSNEALLTPSNYEKIQRLADKFPDRFLLVVTKKEWIYFPTLRTEENHTKFLVIDGIVCMTGGTGIQDMLVREKRVHGTKDTFKERLMGKACRDMDVVVKGPVSKTMRHQFYQLLEKWHRKTSSRRVYGNMTPFTPVSRDPTTLSLTKTGFLKTQATMITSSYEHGSANECKHAYIDMIRGAQKSLVIANMFFYQKEILQAVQEAIGRGVKVTVITNVNSKNSAMSMKMLGIANRLGIAMLKGSDTKVYAYDVEGCIYHKKVMIVDEHITVIGSFNISKHCADTEDENLMILDSKQLAKKTQEVLEEDISKSQEITRHEISWLERLQAHAMLQVTGNILQ